MSALQQHTHTHTNTATHIQSTNATGKTPNKIRPPADDTCQYSFRLKDAVDVAWWFITHLPPCTHTCTHTHVSTSAHMRQNTWLLSIFTGENVPHSHLSFFSCIFNFWTSCLIHPALPFHSLLPAPFSLYKSEACWTNTWLIWLDYTGLCNDLADLLNQVHVTVKHFHQFHLQAQARKKATHISCLLCLWIIVCKHNSANLRYWNMLLKWRSYYEEVEEHFT